MSRNSLYEETFRNGLRGEGWEESTSTKMAEYKGGVQQRWPSTKGEERVLGLLLCDHRLDSQP